MSSNKESSLSHMSQLINDLLNEAGPEKEISVLPDILTRKLTPIEQERKEEMERHHKKFIVDLS